MDQEHCEGMRLHRSVLIKYNGQVVKYLIRYCTLSE